MRTKSKALCGLLTGLALILTMLLSPAAASTSFTNAEGYLNVQAFGAKGDGTTNDTAAVQKAVNAARSGGKTVFFPAGLYNISGSVTVPAGVKLEGITSAANGPWQNLYDGESKGKKYNGLSSSNYWDPDIYAGSWILAANGSGNVDAGGTFRLSGDNTVSKLGFVTLMTPPLYAAEVTPTAPVIAVDIEKMTSTKGIVIEDISLTNPYYGIAVYRNSLKKDTSSQSLGKKSSGPITIRNIMGAALYRGISVIGADGKVTLHNLQFNYATYDKDYCSAHFNRCIDIDLAACADVTVRNVLSFGAQTGLRTFSAYSGSPVNLTAVSLNLEGEKPLILSAGGKQTVRNSYFLLTNFANFSKENKYRAVTITQDKACSTKTVYTLENLMFQDAMGTDSMIYDITLQGGATVNAAQNLVWNFSSTQPIIRYTHTSGAASAVTFTGLAFCSDKSGTLAAVGGSAYRAGELTFRYSRFPNGILGKLTSDSSVKFDRCTRGLGGGSTAFSH